MKLLSRRLITTIASVGALLLLLLTVYLVGIGHYKSRLLPGTKINGTDLGGMTVEEAREAMQAAAQSYVLSVTGRNAAEAQFRGDLLSLTYQDQGELEQLILEQKESEWIAKVGHTDARTIQLTYGYDAEMLDQQLASLSFLQPGGMQRPADAYVADTGHGYTVAAETQGSWLETESVRDAIILGMENGVKELDLDAAGLYSVPARTTEDQQLQNQAAYLNGLLNQTITYDFVDRQYTVDRDVIRSWIIPDESGNCNLNSAMTAQWVYSMAYETDTFANSHLFTTHNGEQILLAPGGDYGWVIDQEQTTAALLQALNDGFSGNLKPVYVYTAQDRSSDDIGGTYVEVCLSEQTMYLYEDHQLKLSTPVITGNHSTGYDTPSGSVWAIDGKKYQMQFTLFDVAVEYWLPFNGDCGIHDADWRSAGEYVDPAYYLENGSHGCVNTPYDAMETVFETVEIGYPVIVYYSAEQPVGPEPTQDVSVG